MQKIGVPYTDQDIAGSEDMARAQAAAVADKIVKQGGPKGLEESQIVALIAYVQRLGTDLFVNVAPPRQPATRPTITGLKYEDP
jgi:cytochrome c oxidase cbb3-type subunit I/II